MWTRTHSKLYPRTPASAVWALWADVNGWAQWHGDLDFCRMEGPFQAGTEFSLRPKGGPTVKIQLLEVEPGRGFTDLTRFPGARMVDIHRLEETPEGLRLSNTVEVSGPLGFLWVKLVAQGVAASAPAEMDAVAALAQR
jgi:hypothetical protein